MLLLRRLDPPRRLAARRPVLDTSHVETCNDGWPSRAELMLAAPSRAPGTTPCMKYILDQDLFALTQTACPQPQELINVSIPSGPTRPGQPG